MVTEKQGKPTLLSRYKLAAVTSLIYSLLVILVLGNHSFYGSLLPSRLDPASRTPLYVQLVDHLKHAVETGAVRAGERLPSVRRMAEDLLINPNTVVRAYRDLEQEGIVVLKHGSGVFVRESVVARTELMKEAEPILRAAVDQTAFG